MRLPRLARRTFGLLAEPVATYRTIRDPGDAHPTFRRRVVRLTVAGVALVAVAGAGAVLVPVVFVPVLVAVVAVVALSRLRMRHGWGASAGLPQGPIRHTPGLQLDPGYLGRLRDRHGAVFKTNFGSRPMVCIADLGEGAAFVRSAADALDTVRGPMYSVVPTGFLRGLEGTDHGAYRRLLATAFSRRLALHAPHSLVPIFREVVPLLADADDAERCLHDALVTGWGEVFFGVRLTADEVTRLRSLHRRFDILSETPPTDASRQALLEAIALVRGAAPVADPDHVSAVSELAAAGVDAYGDPCLAGNLAMLAQSSGNDTGGLLLWLLYELSGRPELLDRVADESARRLRDEDGDGDDAVLEGPTLADRIVSETLRLHQSEFVLRRTVRPVSCGPYRIPPAWNVRVCVAQAHRDPSIFEQPDAFDPDRFLRRRFDSTEYSPFGIDRHSCVGEQLARAAGRAFVEVLAEHEVRRVADGPLEYGYWRHWAPSSAFRVSVISR